MCDWVKLLMKSGSAAVCDFKRLLCPIKCWINQFSIVVTTVGWKTIVNLQSLYLLHITALPREDGRLQLKQLSTSESSSIHYVGVVSLLAQTQASSPDLKIYNSLPVVDIWIIRKCWYFWRTGDAKFSNEVQMKYNLHDSNVWWWDYIRSLCAIFFCSLHYTHWAMYSVYASY